MARRRGGEPMASQMVVASILVQARGHGGCIRGACGDAAVGVENDGPFGMSLGGVQALAVEFAHGVMLRVDCGVFTQDAEHAVIVGAGGTVALD
eukprot:14760639-Heterocapsa_arctica.AAC.1